MYKFFCYFIQSCISVWFESEGEPIANLFRQLQTWAPIGRSKGVRSKLPNFYSKIFIRLCVAITSTRSTL